MPFGRIGEGGRWDLFYHPKERERDVSNQTRQPAPGGWRIIVEASKDAYWKARRDGKDESAALVVALDVAVAAATGQC